MSFFNKTNPICLRFLPGREKISGVLFALTAWAYLFCATITATTLKSTHKAWFNRCSDLMWFILIAAVVNILLLEDYKIRDLIIIIAAGALFFASMHFGGSKHLLQGFVLAMSGKHVNWKLFMGFTTFFYAALIAAVIVAFKYGDLTAVSYARDDRIRTALGFNHPNVFAGYLMVFCICWMMWRFESLNILDYILFALIGAYCWLYPDSRTATTVIFIMIIILPLFQYAGDWLIRHVIFKIPFLLVFPAAAVGSVVLSRMYWSGGRWFKILNKALGGRIAVAHAFLQKYSIPLLGKNIGTVKKVDGVKVSAALENSYVRILLENGVIAAVVVLVLFTLLVYAAMKHRNVGLLLGLCLMAVYGLVLNRLTKVAFDVPMLAMPLIFTARPKKKPQEPSKNPRVDQRFGRDSQ